MVENKVDKVDCIKLSIPSKAEYVSIIRLTTSAIASRMGFDIEEIEDIKVAIAEACTNTLENGLSDGSKNFDIEFDICLDKLIIKVKDNGKGNANKIKDPINDELEENNLGIFIINSLMDEVDIINNEDEGIETRMIKYIKDDVR